MNRSFIRHKIYLLCFRHIFLTIATYSARLFVVRLQWTWKGWRIL